MLAAGSLKSTSMAISGTALLSPGPTQWWVLRERESVSLMSQQINGKFLLHRYTEFLFYISGSVLYILDR